MTSMHSLIRRADTNNSNDRKTSRETPCYDVTRRPTHSEFGNSPYLLSALTHRMLVTSRGALDHLALARRPRKLVTHRTEPQNA